MPSQDELPPGPLRALTEALHELYRDAGNPALRHIAAEVARDRDGRFRDTVSHETVSAMLRGSVLVKWMKLEPVVFILAGQSTPARTPDLEILRFKRLWNSAASMAQDEDVPVSVPVEGRLRSAFILGGVTGETDSPAYEAVILAEFCKRLGAAVAEAGVELIVCSPFPDSADFHAMSGFLRSTREGTVHMHMPRDADVEAQYEQLTRVVGPLAVERIKVWYYPGPETEAEGAIGQAWVLCQLMAMEQADVVIAVGGKPDKTASTVLHYAQVKQKPIVPFSFFGGAAERVFKRRDWAAIHPRIDPKKLESDVAVADVMGIANAMVTSRLSESNPHSGIPCAVFISRARVDIAYARALDRYLTDRGITVLFGERGLPVDRTIESAIEDAVLRSDLFIVLWSRAYAASRYCYDEIQLALQRHRVGELRLWIFNLDGSDIVPPDARALPRVLTRSTETLLTVVEDLLGSA